MKVLIDDAAQKQLAKVTRPGQREKLINAIAALELNPAPRGCEKMSGRVATWKIRVGDWRIVYTRRGDTLTVIKVGDRRDVYKH